MSNDWFIAPHSGADKSFAITGPEGYLLLVDYDDVDHDLVDIYTDAVVTVLNEAWRKGGAWEFVGMKETIAQRLKNVRENRNKNG